MLGWKKTPYAFIILLPHSEPVWLFNEQPSSEQNIRRYLTAVVYFYVQSPLALYYVYLI